MAHKTAALTTGAQFLLFGNSSWPRAWEQWRRASLGLRRSRLYSLWGLSPRPLAHTTIALTTGAQFLLSSNASWPRAWEQWRRGSLGLQRDSLYSLWGSNPRPMAHKTIALTTELRGPI